MYMYCCPHCKSLEEHESENNLYPCKKCKQELLSLKINKSDWEVMPKEEKRDLVQTTIKEANRFLFCCKHCKKIIPKDKNNIPYYCSNCNEQLLSMNIMERQWEKLDLKAKKSVIDKACTQCTNNNTSDNKTVNKIEANPKKIFFCTKCKNIASYEEGKDNYICENCKEPLLNLNIDAVSWNELSNDEMISIINSAKSNEVKKPIMEPPHDSNISNHILSKKDTEPINDSQKIVKPKKKSMGNHVVAISLIAVLVFGTVMVALIKQMKQRNDNSNSLNETVNETVNETPIDSEEQAYLEFMSLYNKLGSVTIDNLEKMMDLASQCRSSHPDIVSKEQDVLKKEFSYYYKNKKAEDALEVLKRITDVDSDLRRKKEKCETFLTFEGDWKSEDYGEYENVPYVDVVSFSQGHGSIKRYFYNKLTNGNYKSQSKDETFQYNIDQITEEGVIKVYANLGEPPLCFVREGDNLISYYEAGNEKTKMNALTYHRGDLKKETSKPRIGMTASEVRATSWGWPKDVNTTTYSGGISEQWCYSDNRYVYFDNGICTAIQE